jgi:5-methylcytosine-specific restriction protein A
MQLVLQPCAGDDANEHFVHTIQNPVLITRLASFLSQEERSQIAGKFGDSVAVWGVTPGEDDGNAKKWQRMNIGDTALFYKKRQFFYKGTVAYKIHSAQMAESLWNKKEDGSTWEYIFFLTDLEAVAIDVRDFNQLAGRKETAIVQGFTVLESGPSAKILDALDLTSDAGAVTTQPAEQAAILNLDLKIGGSYTRAALQVAVGVEPTQGGPWYTGYLEHQGVHFVFCSVGAAGRTGHDYENKFVGDDLVWYGKTGSRLDHPSVQALLADDAVVHVFYREDDRAPFTYAGQARAKAVQDTSPVKLTWSFADDPQVHPEVPPEEIESEPQGVIEGAKKQITVNIYERDPNARRKCIAYWKARCVVCEFNFGSVYGELGKGYIHVHHLKPLAEIGEEYVLDPVNDLRPVCPNCHAMLHRRKPALSIDELVGIIASTNCVK